MGLQCAIISCFESMSDSKLIRTSIQNKVFVAVITRHLPDMEK